MSLLKIMIDGSYEHVKTSLGRVVSVKDLKMMSMPKHVRPSIQIDCVIGVMEWLQIDVIFAPGKLC